jgi:catechol 2,3-dioxygenase-like lactoylglutathione lyase family enzyme
MEVHMSSIAVEHEGSAQHRAASLDLKLEVVVVPVNDVDRAKRFYVGLGFRVDADYVGGPGFRVVQLTPPGSTCSIIIGEGITSASPGSADGLVLVVYDLELARAEMIGRGAKVSEPFVDAGGVFHHVGDGQRVPGVDPEDRAYRSQASFSDPDGNTWYLQEVKTPAPGR